LCAIIAAATGCQQKHVPEPDHATVAVVRDDARSVDATRADANEVIPVFDFIGAGVPTGFGGVSLGDPLPAVAQRQGTFGGANADLWVGSDDGTTVSQIGVWIDGDIEPVLAKRFGRKDQDTWKGAASWVVTAPLPFDFSGGAPGTRLVIVRPDEHHVCGRDDGFAAFYATLQRNVRAHDWDAVARSMTFPQTDWSDSEGAEVSVGLSGPADLVADPTSVFRFELRGGSAMCDLGYREYTVVYGTARLSPAIYAVRGAHGEWRIIDIGHAPHDLW
jgi:hypothetical protein